MNQPPTGAFTPYPPGPVLDVLNDTVSPASASTEAAAVTPLDQQDAAVLGEKLGEPTRSEYKKAMRQFFTVQHPSVVACGHRLDTHRLDGPTTNCPYCWFVFFNENGELVRTLDEMFTQHGASSIIYMRGEKFFKNYMKFMATVAAMKRQNGGM